MKAAQEIWHSTDAAVARLRLSRWTLWRERERGRLHGEKRHGRVYYSERELTAYEERYGLLGEDT